MEQTQNGTRVVIEVKNLWKIFGSNPGRILKDRELRGESCQAIQEKTGNIVALRDVSFTVNKGEMFVIMGLSGSGKSTLIRCLPRLTEPTAGEILIDGEDVLKYGSAKLRHLRRHTMSMVFQHYGLLPHRTVIENIAYGLEIRGMKKEESKRLALEAVERVGLKGWENNYPTTLSGGMQQRVGLARALANNPEILLMDEPFSGLDPLIRRQMQDQLIELQAEVQKTILFVTHDLDEALKLGNRIALMKDGEIVQTGTPEEIVTNPSCDYVRQFVQDVSPSKVLAASSIMTPPGFVLYGWMGPQTALHSLRRARRNYGFVVTARGKFLGAVTLEELENMRREKPFGSIKDGLTTDIQTTGPDTLAAELPNLAVTSPYPIPVLNEEGELMGEISNEVLLGSLVRSDCAPEEVAAAEEDDTLVSGAEGSPRQAQDRETVSEGEAPEHAQKSHPAPGSPQELGAESVTPRIGEGEERTNV